MPNRYLATKGDAFDLQHHCPADTYGSSERDMDALLKRNQNRIAELQNVLYAESERSLLVILQSMDTGGKDPIIRDVLAIANPRLVALRRSRKRPNQRRNVGHFGGFTWTPLR
jgi:polyphosphate kinase 2 (PPK2 family)